MKQRHKSSISFMFMALNLTALNSLPAVFGQEPTLSGRTLVIPAGTTFEGRLDSTIGSKLSRQGERFTITVAAPVLANGTMVLIPSGAQVQGEVVEAIPADKVPHAKGTVKPVGKLETELTSIRLPDGGMYPLIAKIIADKSKTRGGAQDPLGTGVAYAGSQGSFNAVSPNNRSAVPGRRAQPMKVLTQDDLAKDPILGLGKTNAFRDGQIGSLVKKKRDYFIYSGSPLTMRLDAPLRNGARATAGAASVLNQPEEAKVIPGDHRRFEHNPSSGNQSAPDAEGGSGAGGGEGTPKPTPPKKDDGDF